MSLSSETRSSEWGTIFMGPGPSGETTLERVEAGGPTLAWTMGTEAEYLDRVRVKAAAKAKEILLEAQAEAGALREKGETQGYEAGLAQAQAELEEFRQNMGASVGAVLGAIEGHAGVIAKAWRDELVDLTRLCVETAIGHELSGHRAELLATLFDGAMQKMAEAQRISILVSPDDEPVVADMLDAAGQRYEQTFTVRAEASLAPGSLVLESDASRADNSLTVRRAVVENILAQLIIPEDSPAEAQAAETAAAPAVAPEALEEPRALVAAQMDPAAPADFSAPQTLAEAETFAATALVPEAELFVEPEVALEPHEPEAEAEVEAPALESEFMLTSPAEVGVSLEPESAPEFEPEVEVLTEPELLAAPEASAAEREVSIVTDSEVSAAEGELMPEGEAALAAEAPVPVLETEASASGAEADLLAEIFNEAGLQEVPLPAAVPGADEAQMSQAESPGVEIVDPFELAQALMNKTP